MCGFVGCLYNQPNAQNILKEKIVEMNEAITHRGPDDEGYYFNEYVNFGFRRLSIIDVPNGSQPLSL